MCDFQYHFLDLLTDLIAHPDRDFSHFVFTLFLPFFYSTLCIFFRGCHWKPSFFFDQVNPSLFSSSSISFLIEIFFHHPFLKTFITQVTYMSKPGQMSFSNYVFNIILLFCTFSYFIDGDMVLQSDIQYCSKTIVFTYVQLFGIKLREGSHFRTICSNW